VELQNYIVEIAYSHTQEDLDLVEVRARSRRAAEAEVRNRWRFSRWTELRDVTIQGVVAHERSRGPFLGSLVEVVQ